MRFGVAFLTGGAASHAMGSRAATSAPSTHASAIELRVTSKSRPNCQSDRDRKLDAEATAIQKELSFR
jgi:hypothetical protein